MDRGKRIALVVAVAPGGIIGRNGGLPWHLPEDLAWFKRVTMGKAMIMGRRTWESIGRPLPGRDSIVVTRNPHWAAPGAHAVASLAEALTLAARLRPECDEIAIIGGAEIFAQSLSRADRLYWTEVKQAHDGDTAFPPVDWSDWRETERTEHERVAFVVLDKKENRPAE